MSLDPKRFGTLFEMSRDAVLGVENGIISFINPAASTLLNASVGDPADNYIPDYILSDPAEQFFATMTLYTRPCEVSVIRSGAHAVLSIVVPQEVSPVPGSVNRSMRDLSSLLLSAKLAIDILVNKTNADNNPKLRDYTSALYRDYYRMKRLSQHISASFSLSGGTTPFFPKPVLLDSLIRDLCDSVSYFAEDMGIQLTFETDNAVYTTLADPDLIELMLLNLFCNSIGHSKAGTSVHVKLTTQANRHIISIDDCGEGMPAEKLINVYRNDSASDIEDGIGLGLSIARGIAELHSGALILESRKNAGTKLRISLPIKIPKDIVVHNSMPDYNSSGMDQILTEFSVILDKKFYNKTMFD